MRGKSCCDLYDYTWYPYKNKKVSTNKTRNDGKLETVGGPAPDQGYSNLFIKRKTCL